MFNFFRRVFRPNLVLVRQNLRDAGENYKNILFGFMYAGIPSINSLNAIYNFQVSYLFSYSSLRSWKISFVIS